MMMMMKNRKIFHQRFLRQSCPFIIYLFIYLFILSLFLVSQRATAAPIQILKIK